MNFCAWQNTNPLAMIPSSEVFRLPRACSSIQSQCSLHPRLLKERADRSFVYPFSGKLNMRSGSRSPLRRRLGKGSLWSLVCGVFDLVTSRAGGLRLFVGVRFQGVPTSTSRTVVPPVMVAVVEGGGGGREVGESVGGWLELTVVRLDVEIAVVNFFRPRVCGPS